MKRNYETTARKSDIWEEKTDATLNFSKRMNRSELHAEWNMMKLIILI